MKKVFIICVIICVLQLIAAAVLYPYLPAQVPRHWNAAGVIDGYSGKWIMFVFPVITFVTTLFLTVLPKIDPKGDNISKSPVVLGLSVLFVAVVMTVVMLVIVCSSLGAELGTVEIISAVVGIFFVLIGNFMPKIKHNYFVGIKTPWTLANEVVWQKTHRAGGWVFFISGVLFIAGIFVPAPFGMVAPVAVLFGGVAWTFVYSFLVFKKTLREPPAAGEQQLRN